MFMSALSISMSGMQAAEAQLTAVASNVANMTDVGSPPGSSSGTSVYQPIDVVDMQSGSGTQPAGVAFSFARNPQAYAQTYSPTSPAADANGMVATPQVDLADQMAKLAYAKLQFTASAKVAAATSSMQQAAVDMMA